MAKKKNIKKITLEEYIDKNTSPENIKAAKSFLFILQFVIAIVLLAVLFFVVLRLYEINEYAGHIGAVFSVVMFIVGYLVPVIKLKNTKAFMTNVTSENARAAQKYNKVLREEIADKMIDIAEKTEDLDWYSQDSIGKLAIARHTKNDEELKNALTEVYKTDVKKAANKLIRQTAVRVGIATAISQSELVDTMFVIVYQLNLIKDIVFLYGYRPTETQMVKIYKNVLINALIAYGTSTATGKVGKTIGGGIIDALDKASQSKSAITSTIASFAGGLAGVAVESGMQFVVNTSLTIKIGHQTRKYLIREYKLQEMLDSVEILIEDEDEEKLMESIKKEVKDNITKRPKKQDTAPAS